MTIYDLLDREQEEESWDWYQVACNVLGGVFIAAVLYFYIIVFFCL